MPTNNLDNVMHDSQISGAEPDNAEEFYKKSFSNILAQSVGYFVVCEFLIGSNNLVEKSGILYSSGVNFLAIKDPDSERFTVCDLYSLKFVTIYDSKVRPRNFNSRSQTYTPRNHI